MKVNYFISIIFGEIRYCPLFFFLTAKKECKNRYDDYFFQIVYNDSAMIALRRFPTGIVGLKSSRIKSNYF
ncbi:hypothetical protein AREALGSMS7_01967 [Arenibacter algicola]|uniref:Uncharacterized protein n=1 Tax=Arenibacter algicola TaxID=616991 RepID=A0A221UW74_9FLAO|nr:hypothetical protein AREALGSMS7_01967 [Arenibacter algicola]